MKPPFRESALQYLDALYGYAMTLTRNRADSEDLLQETYLRAIRTSGRLRPDSDLKTWLFTILRNAWLNHERRGQDGPLIVDIDENGMHRPNIQREQSDDPLTGYLTKLKHHDVRSAIEGLPVVYREVLLLREFEELSYQELAEVLQCPVGTVMLRLGRAREKLKVALQHWVSDEHYRRRDTGDDFD
jgi:RNA polymerase sigma-70 factor, ECF subfamily